MSGSKCLELLESRNLMSADLAGSYVSLESTSLPAGTTHVELSVQLQNLGDTAATGRFNFRVFASADETLDADDLMLVSRLAGFSGTIAPGTSTEALTFQVDIPTDAAIGTYRLITQIDPHQRIIESNEDNNLIVSEPVAITAPAWDVSASLTSLRLSESIISAVDTRGAVKFNLSNLGATKLPLGQTVSVRAMLRPIDGQSGLTEVQISEDRQISASRLSNERARPVHLAIVIPATVAAGQYEVVVQLDHSGVIAELDESNNELVAGRVSIASSNFDLSVMDATSTLAPMLIPGDRGRGTISIQNTGNVAMRGTANIEFLLQPEQGDPMVINSVVAQRLSLAVGATRNINAALQIPSDAPAGAYSLSARVTWTGPGTEVNTYDNSSAVADYIVSAPFVDLATNSASTTFLSNVVAGQRASGILSVTNNGNVAAVGTVRVEFFLVADGMDDIRLNTGLGERMGLRAGATRSYRVSLSVPATVQTGTQYTVVARISANEPLVDSNLENNRIGAGTIRVA